MTTFNSREDGFEAKFAHDEEIQFKARARRDRLIGHWAAMRLGLEGAAAEAYAKRLVALEFEADPNRAIVIKLHADLAADHLGDTEAQIAAKLDELMATALAQVKAGV